MEGHADPVVGHPVRLEVVCPDLLRAAPASHLAAADRGLFGLLTFLLGLEETGPEHPKRLGLVLELALLVLHRHHQPGRTVGDPHRRVGGIHRLATRTRRPVDVDLEVLVVDGHLHLVGLGKHGDRGRRGVNPPLRLGDRHPLHPVDAALVLQPGPSILPADHEHHLSEPSHVRRSGPERLDDPGPGSGQALVHVVEVASEQVRLLPSLGTTDLDDDRPPGVGVARQQPDTELPFESLDLLLQAGDLELELVAFLTVGSFEEFPSRVEILSCGAQRPT